MTSFKSSQKNRGIQGSLPIRRSLLQNRWKEIPSVQHPYTTRTSRYKARHAHKRLYTVPPKYSKIQVLPGITSCRLVKDNKQAIELNSLLLNNMPKDGYG